jgi:hypothetical protein
MPLTGTPLDHFEKRLNDSSIRLETVTAAFEAHRRVVGDDGMPRIDYSHRVDPATSHSWREVKRSDKRLKCIAAFPFTVSGSSPLLSQVRFAWFLTGQQGCAMASSYCTSPFAA